MSTEPARPAAEPIILTPLPPPSVPAGNPWRLLIVLTLLFGVPAGLWAAGLRPSHLWRPAKPAWTTVVIDRGDIETNVIESGTLESAHNTLVRCKVEALMGQVGGAQGQGGAGGRGGAQAKGGQGGNLSSGTVGGASAPTGAAALTAAAAKAAAAKKAAATTSAGTSTTTSSSTATTSTTATTTGATTTSTMGATSGTTTPTTTSTTMPAPVIESFSYTIEPYVPLRPQTTVPVKAPPPPPPPPNSGGNRGGSQTPEQPGATRILSIVREGTSVKAGDLVCTLDASAFVQEVQAQRISSAQALAWVEQAKALYVVNQITLRQYRDGIYPKDTQALGHYLIACKIEEERAKSTYDWSLGLLKKHLRPQSQFKADLLTWQRSQISRREADRMLDRLHNYTAPRLIKALEAKLEANRADLLAQQAAYQLESTRLKRLEAMVEHCTLRAPIDGIVVYSNQADRRGRMTVQIDEGVTVRENQPIFSIPDTSDMQVKVMVNESKVALVHSGQEALVIVDAFPEIPLHGTVAEVTAIPAPSNGPFSDVHIYYAMVHLDAAAFKQLRPGLSAEVTFDVATRKDVTRIPIEALRWVEEQAFAALPTAQGPLWKPVELGLISTMYAEVRSGLAPGDRVIADPSTLSPPLTIDKAVPTVADARATTGSAR